MKHKGFYLQKVFFILTGAEAFLPFGETLEQLQAVGIAAEVLLVEEFLNREAPAKGCTKYLSEEKKEILKEEKNTAKEESFWQCEQALFITDSYAVAEHLYQRNRAILGYRHKGNGEEGFPGIPYILEEPEGTPAEYLERVFRRYAGLPWSILETERCYVRESTEEDVEAFYEIYKEPEVTRYTEGLFEHVVSEKAYIREYIEKVYAYFEFGVWTVILKDCGEIIGRAGISTREGFDTPELGYILGLPWQGKCLAKEVCEGILQYAKEELEITQLQVLIQEGNEASVRLAEKLGFEKKEELDMEGKPHIRMVLW